MLGYTTVHGLGNERRAKLLRFKAVYPVEYIAGSTSIGTRIKLATHTTGKKTRLSLSSMTTKWGLLIGLMCVVTVLPSTIVLPASEPSLYTQLPYSAVKVLPTVLLTVNRVFSNCLCYYLPCKA